MPALSLVEVQDFVRTHGDFEVDDLADSVLNILISDGFRRVFRKIRNSDWYAVDASLTTVANQQTYDLRVDLSEDIRHIHSVRGPTWVLEPRQHRHQREDYSATTTNIANPTSFSVWGQSLYLWLTPGSVQTLSVTGWRYADDWITAATTVDAPEDFHELVAFWALNRAYSQQDDPELSAFYRDEFEHELELRSRELNENHSSQPQIMGGRSTTERFLRRNGLGPLIYPWQ